MREKGRWSGGRNDGERCIDEGNSGWGGRDGSHVETGGRALALGDQSAVSFSFMFEPGLTW